VTLDARGPPRLEAVPLTLGYCRTRLASGDDAIRLKRRFRHACEELGIKVTEEAERLVIDRP
jgi:hypothetical protein